LDIVKILATAALLLLLQAPAPQQVRKARIEGYVVRLGTSEPLERARITIRKSWTDGNAPATGEESELLSRMPQAAVTDGQGHFVIDDLDPGSYSLSAAKNGFARQEYGERAPGRPGTVLVLAGGETLKDVVFRLIPTGAVGGLVTNSRGEPIPAITVQLMRSVYDENGKRTFQSVSSARTNERGEYRMFLITPGRFFVSATPAGPSSPNLSAMAENLVNEPGFPLTYYPGTTDPSTASSIEVQAGAELSNVDFRLTPQQLFRIRGRVVDAATGRSPRMVQVELQPRGPVSAGIQAPVAYNAANGTFEIRDVAPGSYRIHAQLIPDSTNFQLSIADLLKNVSQAAVDVSNADVDNVLVSFTPGFSLRGRIEIQGSVTSTSWQPTGMMVFLQPQESTLMPPSLPQNLKADGTFTIENVQPGDYRVTIEGQPPNSYIKSALLGRVDVLNGFNLSGPTTDSLEVVLSTAAGEIEGTVVDSDRKPMRGVQVVLIPSAQRTRPDLYHIAASDQNGHFTMSTVVPGDYRLFAWEDLEPYAYMDPDFLRKYEDQGTSLVVLESSKSTIETKMIPASR
jgi:hypothetical protein